MSDNAPADQQAAPEASGPAQLREALERAKSQLAEKDEQLASLQQTVRNSVFDQAGVPADKWGEAFRKTYDGDLSADAIKAKVEEWGVAPATQPVPSQVGQPVAEPPVVDQAEAAALAQAQSLRGEPATPPNANALQEALNTLAASGDFTQADIDRVYNDHGLLELLD